MAFYRSTTMIYNFYLISSISIFSSAELMFDADTSNVELHVSTLVGSKCGKFEATNISDLGTSEGDWYVVKATAMPQELPLGYDMNVNFCTHLNFHPEICRCISFSVVKYEDQSLTIHTFAVNKYTNSTIHFGNNAKPLIKDYGIYQGVPAVMEEYTDAGYKLFNPIPNAIVNSQAMPFAKIARSSQNKWMIFTTCDVNQHIWVVISADIVTNKNKSDALRQYQQECDNALATMGIDMSQMVNVPIDEDCLM